MASSALRLGTRGSQLALFQAHAVANLLHQHTGRSCEIVVIRTSGDRQAEASLAQIGGKRLFVKEIEDALLAGEINLAVHSSKDMPAALPSGLDIAAVLPREDARDAIVLANVSEAIPAETVVTRLGPAPRIGTSSVRRTAQLIRLFPEARFLPVRGNLDTRLRKVDGGELDALVLAAAGLKRLQHTSRIAAHLPLEVCIPAPGQGIIAVEVRSDDADMQSLLTTIDDFPSRVALDAERAVVTRLGGGCQMPIGAHAVVSDDTIKLSAIVLTLDGSTVIRASAEGSAAAAQRVGASAADQLLAHGAGRILEDVQRAAAAVEGLQP